MYKPRIYAIVYAIVVYSIAGMALAGVLSALPALAESQARIVRLSDVKGTVQIDKNSGLGFESAFANLPITQGTQLRTRDNGRAEIEFEDGSTLRIIPNTTLEFSRLGLSDEGKRISAIKLVEGRAYVNWVGKSGDEFTLNFSQERVSLGPAAHFRVDSSSSLSEVASLKNDLEVLGPSGAVKVGKNKIVSFDAEDNDRSALAKDIEEDPYDQWDEQSIEYHDQHAKNNSTPYGYGSSDLSYYGAYSNVPGYGTLWQPYFVGSGWDPFMDGAWSWYPGMGYMWASAYPWGWMPYYYGNWMNVPGYGWGWQPGGWGTWKGGIHYVGAAIAGFRPPVVPTGTVSAVVVGKGGPVVTERPSMQAVIRSGSAGLGIPRGSYENLHHLNTQVAKTGFVEVHAAPAFAASSPAGGYGYGTANSTGFGGVGHASGGSMGHASGGGGHR
jgi:uncharacterized protein DUF6600/FecR-like protein